MANNTLAAAVQYLYGKGIINKDKDIADKTGYNKATVSSYINGKIEPSAGFIQSFEKTFKIRLQDFKKGGQHEVIPQAVGFVIKYYWPNSIFLHILPGAS